MKISSLYDKFSRVISFEFFPPKTEDAELKLFQAAADLKRLNPSFVSVTYGAMGSTRGNTLRIASKIKKEIGIESAAHLTCVGHSKSEIKAMLAELCSGGIENIVALRGDRPKDAPAGVQGDFPYASDLVRFIRDQSDFKDHFCLAVAGYPEGHVESASPDDDLKHLSHKVAQGADFIVTQLFFNNDRYYRFVERCRKAGIQVPIVPGIMPVTHGPQIQKFALMCGASIPREMEDAIHRYGADSAAIEEFGIDFATRQCRDLLDHGAPGLHFYTLNKSTATRKIHQNLF